MAKIYTEIKIDMSTGETLSEESFEYDGEVAECKGGGGKGYDEEYNKRMAAIAKRAMNMEEASFNVWRHGGGAELERDQYRQAINLLPDQAALEKASMQSALGLIPHQTALKTDALKSSLELLPLQTESQKKEYALGNAKADSAMKLLPHQTGAQIKQLDFGNAQVDSGMRLLPHQEDAQIKQFDLGNVQADYGMESARSAMRLMPHQETSALKRIGYDNAEIDFGMKKIGKKSGLMDDFYNRLGQHDEGSAMGEASADVAGAVTKSRMNNMRNAKRRGVNPFSGGSGLGAAKLEVGARSGARDRIRAKNLNELAMGMEI